MYVVRSALPFDSSQGWFVVREDGTPVVWYAEDLRDHADRQAVILNDPEWQPPR